MAHSVWQKYQNHSLPMSLVRIQDPDHFQQLNLNVGLKVLYFFADWYEPCRQCSQVLESLAKDTSNVDFYQIEAENNPEISAQYPVKSVPTVVLLNSGVVSAVVEGANISAIVQAVKQLGGSSAPATSSPSSSSSSASGNDASVARPAELTPEQAAEQKAQLFARLKELIASHPVMIFIKGTPEEPRCGFSRQLIELLRAHRVRFGFFNILADEAIRQGLKEYSSWPTYPQLYVKNDLIGGLDIVKELHANSELADVFPAEVVLPPVENSESHSSIDSAATVSS